MQTPFALEDLRVEQADAEEAAERGHHLLILRSEALAVALVEALRQVVPVEDNLYKGLQEAKTNIFLNAF